MMVVYLVNKILKAKYYLMGGANPPTATTTTNIFLHKNSFLATKIEVMGWGEGVYVH
jgi:hypothetical protein